MGQFLPLKVKMVDGTIMNVACLADVDIALNGKWRNTADFRYLEAARLLEAAKKGDCKPSVAFAAFTLAARQQGLVQPARPSEALGMFDKVAFSIKLS